MENEEYYLTVYTSAIELIEKMQFSDIIGMTEKEFNEQFKTNSKKYS